MKFRVDSLEEILDTIKTDKKLVVEITGQMYSGKNYIGEKIFNYYYRKGKKVYGTSFASNLKSDVKFFFGIEKDNIEKREINTAEDIESILVNNFYTRYYLYPEAFREVSIRLFDCVQRAYKGDTQAVREILQLYGTEVVRNNINQNYWVNSVVEDIRKADADVSIISDYRFANEDLTADFSKSDFEVVRIRVIASLDTRAIRGNKTREQLIESSDHDSERNIQLLPVEFELVNEN